MLHQFLNVKYYNLDATADDLKSLTELFEILFHNNIPIYIISGGILEIIEETLRLLLPHYETMKEKNMIHIISNSFTYDEGGVINGHREPFVYTFNKGEVLSFKIGIKKYLQRNTT